jgi:ATP-dependent RNA helicase DDX23/PRP28
MNSFFSTSNNSTTKQETKPNHYIQHFTKQVKKPVKRKRDKFIFDWNEQDDTLKNVEYVDQPLFGRNQLAGFDKPVKHLDDRHWLDKPLNEMMERDWRICREDYGITTRGTNVANPLRSWKESNIPVPIINVIEQIGYIEPTPIQRQAIPIAMDHRDIIGVAETGSGKTASFLIPMLCLIHKLPSLDYSNAHLGPYAMILAPTRELALQIESECTRFSKAMGFHCVSIVGGHSADTQSRSLMQGTHIIIATPGRLVEFVERRLIALSQCYFLVMDEADKMIDMGFEDSLHFILANVPSNRKEMMESQDTLRQTVMFSATMPPAVEKLAKTYLVTPIHVNVGQAGQVVDRIEQRVEFIQEQGSRLTRLQRILTSREFQPPIIVFVNQKKTCDVVATMLEKYDISCATLHGGKSQDQRESALLGLKKGYKKVLVATDVAGRGIDIKNVSLVVNFDMAKNISEYTHRIGRTGRAGNMGCSITFLGTQDQDVLYDLRVLLTKSPVSIVPPELARNEHAMVQPGKQFRNITL